MNLFFQHGASPRLQVAKDAATNGDLATIRRMVEREGYDVRTDLTGCAWTLAHAVAEKGHWECLRYLVCRDPSITRAKTLLGTTVLHTSVGSGCPIELVRLLVEKGARVDAVDGQGTVLHSCSNKELVQYFLQLGTPNPNIKNDEELTALGMAVYKKNFDVLKALVESGKADVDLQDFRGSTLLHLCVQTNPEVSILLYLLTKSKANINIRNNDRKTALDLAVPSSRERLLLLIADLGRSHIKSKKEKTQKRMELSKLLSR